MVNFSSAVQEFESLEQLLLKNVSMRPLRDMSNEKNRSDVRSLFISTQGFDKLTQPQIKYHCVSEENIFNCRIQRLAGTSWQNCAVAAHLFLPLTAAPCPAVLCACGHGKDKLRYNSFGAALAQRGIACLVPDNIGQLERSFMGHWDETAAFDCGFSFIAMLTTELLSALEWLKNDTRFTRIGVAGNSGGGTLSMCLAALAPDYLEAIASTGYPSSFEWISRKRKKHCACNIFPGVLGKIEHCDLYSLFAPKPLRLMQGALDNLIPPDIFKATSGIVERTYRQMGCGKNFSASLWNNTHSWCEESIKMIADFFVKTFNVPTACMMTDDEIFKLTDDRIFGKVYDTFPEWAVDTATLAYDIAGKDKPELIPALEDIWKCDISDEYPELYPSGKTERIMAQWRCFIDGLK